MPTSRRDQTLLVSFVGFFFFCSSLSCPLYPYLFFCTLPPKPPIFYTTFQKLRGSFTMHGTTNRRTPSSYGQGLEGSWLSSSATHPVPGQCWTKSSGALFLPSFVSFLSAKPHSPAPPMLIILLHSKSSTLPASSGHNLFVWSLRAEFSFLSICRLHCFCSKPALVRQKHWLSLENSCQSVCAKIPPEQSGGCLSGLIAILWADLAVLKAKS